METNLNCDLGETSVHHSAENDCELMQLINTGKYCLWISCWGRENNEKNSGSCH